MAAGDRAEHRAGAVAAGSRHRGLALADV